MSANNKNWRDNCRHCPFFEDCKSSKSEEECSEFLNKVSSIRYLESMQGSNPSKIYLYTADCSYNMINTMTYLDGVVLTPHNKLALEYFVKSNLYFLKYPRRVKNKSLRLNLFPDMKALLPKDIDFLIFLVNF